MFHSKKVIDPTTVVVPVFITDEQPVVKLPKMTNDPHPPSSVDNNIVVRLPCHVANASAPCLDTNIPHQPSPATDSPPVQPPGQIPVCLDWVHGRCSHRRCKFLHR